MKFRWVHVEGACGDPLDIAVGSVVVRKYTTDMPREDFWVVEKIDNRKKTITARNITGGPISFGDEIDFNIDFLPAGIGEETKSFDFDQLGDYDLPCGSIFEEEFLLWTSDPEATYQVDGVNLDMEIVLRFQKLLKDN